MGQEIIKCVVLHTAQYCATYCWMLVYLPGAIHCRYLPILTSLRCLAAGLGGATPLQTPDIQLFSSKYNAMIFSSKYNYSVQSV